MKNTNRLFNYFFLFMMFCVICGVPSCKSSRTVREIIGNYERSPVHGKGDLAYMREEPRLSNLKRISHAYSSSGDTFVITLINMDENQSFIDAKDVVVVSSIKDSLAPIHPGMNSNAAFFRPELEFDYYGTKYMVVNATSDGREIIIQKLQTNQGLKVSTIVTDQISNELSISDLKSDNSYNLLATIEAHNKKYVLIYFWLPSCSRCFENIPMLKKLERDGIVILNLFHISDDEIKLVEKHIARFEIPGLNFRSSPELVKYFSQNGFPYSVLVDASANKIVSSEHRIEEHEKYIKF